MKIWIVVMPGAITVLKRVSIILLVILLIFFWPVVMPPWPREDGSNFLRALAEVFRSLQWSLVALIVATFFRQDVRKLLSRMRTAKAFGAEAEFRGEIEDLQHAAEDLAVTVAPPAAVPTPVPDTPGPDTERDAKEDAGPRFGAHEDLAGAANAPKVGDNSVAQRVDQILLELERRGPDLVTESEVIKVAATSPRAGIMLLSTEIEKTLRRLAAMYDAEQSPRRATSALNLARNLVVQEVLDRQEFDVLQKYWRIRNAVVHEEKGNDDDVLSAVDSGLALWSRLKDRLRLAKTWSSAGASVGAAVD